MIVQVVNIKIITFTIFVIILLNIILRTDIEEYVRIRKYT